VDSDFDLNPLIQRKARNGKANKRKRLDLDSTLRRKARTSVKRARQHLERDADGNDIDFYCR